MNRAKIQSSSNIFSVSFSLNLINTISPLDPINQGDTKSVTRCQNGDVIEIAEAWYGKKNKECGVDGKRALDIICGGNRACYITATDDRFPSSNCPAATGTVFYSYRCVVYGKLYVIIYCYNVIKQASIRNTVWLTDTVKNRKEGFFGC